NRLAQRLFAAGVTVSRRPPFVRRNSRYRDRSKMINALGPELGVDGRVIPPGCLSSNSPTGGPRV
ncbi:hypothetical protein, partial [Mycobacterium sp.]|uniref:hypothetical protein n=1 Tax=Mycobacterium sp. TaxID=1785 RepID=UPI0026340045